jgi:hypothetical protein
MLCGAALLLTASVAAADEPLRFHTTTVTYNVADLIVPLDNYTLPVVKLWQQRHPDRMRDCGNIVAEGALINLITETIAPNSWSDAGGRGTVRYYPLGMSLIVDQTPQVHAWIADLLRTLRKMDREYVMECKLVETDTNGRPQEKLLPKITFLDEQRVKLSLSNGVASTSKLATSELHVGIHTQNGNDGTVRVTLQYERRAGSPACRVESTIIRVVEPGQRVRVPVEYCNDHPHTWLVFTLHEVPNDAEE